MMPYQPVPTGVEIAADGTPLVSQLTGFPFPVGEANVYDASTDPVTVAEDGFTNIIDIATAPDGTLYVLEFADNGLLSETPAPALIQVRPDGTRKYLLYGDELPPAGGVAVGPDGMVYLSVCNVCGAGAGMVWKIDPSVASDQATAAACSPDDVPGSGLPDIKSSVHREAIECMVWWDAIRGFTDGTFGPGQPDPPRPGRQPGGPSPRDGGGRPALRPAGRLHRRRRRPRGQHQRARPPSAIVDGYDDGTYRPSNHLHPGARSRRCSCGHGRSVTGDPLPAGPNAFTDDDTSVHHDNINAAAAAGWVNGKGGRQVRAPGRRHPGPVRQHAGPDAVVTGRRRATPLRRPWPCRDLSVMT